MTKKLPSSIQAEESLSQLHAMKQLLSISGSKKDTDDMKKRIENQARAVFATPDLFLDFNKYFNKLGWHGHGSLPIPLLEQANQLAKSNLFEEAEELLVNH